MGSRGHGVYTLMGGDLVKYKDKGNFWMNTKVVGVVTKVTKFSIFVEWANSTGRAGYNKEQVEDILEVING